MVLDVSVIVIQIEQLSDFNYLVPNIRKILMIHSVYTILTVKYQWRHLSEDQYEE